MENPDAALLEAARSNDPDLAAAALRAGADPEVRDDRDRTPLLVAIVLGDGSEPHQEIVRILLAAGADPTVTDRQGRSAREIAVEHGYPKIVRILDQHGPART